MDYSTIVLAIVGNILILIIKYKRKTKLTKLWTIKIARAPFHITTNIMPDQLILSNIKLKNIIISIEYIVYYLYLPVGSYRLSDDIFQASVLYVFTH